MILQKINAIANNLNEETKNELRNASKFLVQLLTVAADAKCDAASESSSSSSLEQKTNMVSYHLTQAAIDEATRYALNPDTYLEILIIIKNSDLNDNDIDNIILLYCHNVTSENDLKASQNVVALAHRVHQITPEYLWLIYINPVIVSYKDVNDGIIESRTTFAHEMFKARKSREFIFSFFELLHKSLSLNLKLITSYLLLSDHHNKSIIEHLYELQFDKNYSGLYDEIKAAFPSLFFYTEQELKSKFLSSKYRYLDENNIVIGLEKSAVQITSFFIDHYSLDKPAQCSSDVVTVSRDAKWEQEINKQLLEFSELLNGLGSTQAKQYSSSSESNLAKLIVVKNFIQNLIEETNLGTGNKLSPSNIMTFGINLKEITAICYFITKHESNWTKKEPFNDRLMNLVSIIYQDFNKQFNMNVTEFFIAQHMLQSIKNHDLVRLEYIQNSSSMFFNIRSRILATANNIFVAYASQLKKNEVREIMTILWEWKEYKILPKNENFILSFCNFFYNQHNSLIANYSFIETIKIIHIIFYNLTPSSIKTILQNISFSSVFINNNSIISQDVFITYINDTDTSRYRLKLEHMHAQQHVLDDMLIRLSAELQQNNSIDTIQRNLQFFNALMHSPNHNHPCRSLSQLATWVFVFKIHAIPDQTTEVLNIQFLLNISLKMSLSEVYKCILVLSITPLNKLEIKQLGLIGKHYQNTLNKIHITHNPDALNIKLIYNHHKAILDKIFRVGKLINSLDEEILIAAVKNNHLELVKYLVYREVSVTYQDLKTKTALHYAAVTGSAEIAAILANKDNILIQDNKGKTALHYACIAQRSEIVGILADSSSIVITDVYGRTAFHYACMKKSLEITFYLMSYNNNIVNFTDSLNNTPLHYSLCNKNEATTNLLLSVRPNLHIENNKQYNALIYAILCQASLDIIKKLIAQDRSILSHLTSTGNNVIFRACKHYYSSYELFELLYKNKLDISQKNFFDITPLLYSLISLHNTSAKFLLKLGDKPWNYEYYDNRSLFPKLPVDVKNIIKKSIEKSRSVISNFKSHHATTKKLCSWIEFTNENQDKVIRNLIGSFNISYALIISIIDINFDLFKTVIKNLSLDRATSNSLLDEAFLMISYQLRQYENLDAKYHPEVMILTRMINYIIVKHNHLPHHATIKLDGLVQVLSQKKLTTKIQKNILHYVQNSALSIHLCVVIEPSLNAYNIPKNTFNSLIFVHIIKRDHSALKNLLAKDCEQVNIATEYGTTPLMLAIMLNDLASIGIILNYTHNINFQNNFGNSALHFASRSQFPIKIFEMLLQKEFNINIVNLDNQTPVLLSQDVNTTLYLMKHNANPWHVDRFDNCLFDILYPESMQFLISKNIFDAATYFIQTNIFPNFLLAVKYMKSINEVNIYNESLLHIAVKYQIVKVIEYLLSNNIDTSIRDCNNCIAFDLNNIQYSFHKEIISLKKKFNIEDSLAETSENLTHLDQPLPSSYVNKLRERVQQEQELELSDNSTSADQFRSSIEQSRDAQVEQTEEVAQSNAVNKLRAEVQHAQSPRASHSSESANQFRSMIEQSRQETRTIPTGEQNAASRLRSQVQQAKSHVCEL